MYCKLGYDNLSRAMRVLSHTGLKLYLYLSKNMDGKQWPLSSADAMQYTGIKKWDTYSKAVQELIDKGFVTQTKPDSNIFDFCIVSALGIHTEPEAPEPQAEPEPIQEPEPQAEPERTEQEPQGRELVHLSTDIERYSEINKALQEVCYRTYGKQYTGCEQLEREAVKAELLNNGIFIDGWIEKRLRDNDCLVSSSLDNKADVLPF